MSIYIMDLDHFRAWLAFGLILICALALIVVIFELRRNRRVLSNQIAALRRSVFHMEDQIVRTQPMYQCQNFNRQRQPANGGDHTALN